MHPWEDKNQENIDFWGKTFSGIRELGSLYFDRFIGEPLQSASNLGQVMTGGESPYGAVDEINTPAVIQEKIVRDAMSATGAAAAPKTFGSNPRLSEVGSFGSSKTIGKYSGSVNLEKQLIDDEAKWLEKQVWDQHGIKIKTKNEDLTNSAKLELEKLKNDPVYYQERIDAIKGGQTPTIEEELAHRMLNAQGMQNFTDMAKKVAKGEAPKEALTAMEDALHTQYMDVTQPLANEAGKRLQMYNIEVGRSRAFKAISELETHLNERQVDDLAKIDWNNPKSVDDFVKRLPDPKLSEYLYEYWYNSILSGIPTHLVNVASNTLWAGWQVPHRGITAGVDSVLSALTGRPRERFFEEMVPLMTGNVKGIPKATRSAWDTFRSNRLSNIEDKWATEMDTALGAFERSPSAAVRAIGVPLTVPTRALRAMDVYTNSIAYDSQVEALAVRAFKQGGSKGNKDEFVRSFKQKPPEWAQDEAVKYSRYTTFTDEPGAISQGIMDLRNAVPGGKLVIPFVRTVGNIMKRGMEMTPGVGLALAKGQAPSEVIAKQIEGSILTLAMFNKIQKGEIIGAAPENTEERERFYAQGKLPWSMKVGDNYIQYRRVEPFNMPISIATTAYDAIKRSKTEDEATEIMMDTVAKVKDHVIDSSYLQGFSNLVDKRGGFKSMPQKMASSFIPFSGFFRSINRAYEAETEGSAKVYKNDEWLSAFAQVIPGLKSLQKPTLNVWGEEIPLQGGAFRQWLPYKWAQQTDDTVEMFFEKLSNNLEKENKIGVYPALPSQWVNHKKEKVKLDDDIYRQYVMDYGKRAKDRIRNNILGETNWSELIETNPDRVKGRINNILETERDTARRRAIREQFKTSDDNEQ